MVKDLRNKFSLDMNIGLLGLKFSVIITLKGGGVSENFSFLASSKIFFYLMRISCLILAVLKEEIPFRCEHFLCYARNGSFHQCLPPSTQRNKGEILFRCEHFLCYAGQWHIRGEIRPILEKFSSLFVESF